MASRKYAKPRKASIVTKSSLHHTPLQQTTSHSPTNLNSPLLFPQTAHEFYVHTCGHIQNHSESKLLPSLIYAQSYHVKAGALQSLLFSSPTLLHPSLSLSLSLSSLSDSLSLSLSPSLSLSLFSPQIARPRKEWN